MATEGCRVIAVSVLFDLMDRYRDPQKFVTSTVAIRVALQWAAENDLLPVVQLERGACDRQQTSGAPVSPRDFVFSLDDDLGRMVLGAMDGDKQDREDDAGPSVAPPAPPEACALPSGEGPQVSAADGAGGDTEPLPAQQQNTLTVNSSVPLAVRAGGGESAPAAETHPGVSAAPATADPLAHPVWWREIEAVLNALGHKAPWTPQMDLALVEGIMAGTPQEVLADDLGVNLGQMRQRFIAMTPDAVDRTGRSSVTIELQQRLIQVLRARAGIA